MTDIDVTELMDFNNPDDETLPVTECVCGAKFEPWTFYISIYREDPYHCPVCNRALYFRSNIHVYEVKDD